ncbi:MAG: hypothetical protein H7X83_00440 [Verrucomicrobia bacterium]|nr:hypothetical protein [Deltaproteobacteria bacterium]
MDIAGMQMWSEKMRIVLGVIFILFIVCFIAIVVEETFLGGRRRRKALKIARERQLDGGLNSATSDRAPQN